MGAHVVDGCQAELILCHVLQVLVETHQLLLIVELRHDIKTMKEYKIQKCDPGNIKSKHTEKKARRYESLFGKKQVIKRWKYFFF